MATGGPADIREEFLTCSICYEVFTEPKSLPCLHNFCQKCLTDYILALPKSEMKNGFRCPTCREQTTPPRPSRPAKEWAGQFKTNFQWKALIDMLACQPSNPKHKGEHSSTKGEHSCPPCEEHAAPLDLYCVDCCRVVCHMCAGVRHRRCAQVVTVREAADQRRAMLDIRLAQLTDLQRHQASVSAEIQKALTHLHSQKETAETQIAATADGLVQIIKAKEAQLKEDLRGQVETIEKKVKAKMEFLNSDTSIWAVKNKELKTLKDDTSDFALMQANFDSVLATQPTSDRAVEKLRETLRSVTVQFSPSIVPNERLGERFSLGSVSLETGLQQRQDHSRLKQSLHQSSSNVLRPRAATVSAVETPTRTEHTSPVLVRTICSTRRDDTSPADLRDVIVLTPSQTVLVTDYGNQAVKAFFPRRDKDCSLPMGDKPWGIAQLSPHKVAVSLPSTRQICQLQVTETLMLVTSVVAVKRYAGLAPVDSERLVATAASDPPCVDVINLAGEVTHSFTRDARGLPLFVHPAHVASCRSESMVYISDKVKAALTCMDGKGKVVWRFGPKGVRRMQDPQGVCWDAWGSGRVLVAERRGVLVFTPKGDFKGPLVHLSPDHPAPQGMYMSPTGLLYLTQGGKVLVYQVR